DLVPGRREERVLLVRARRGDVGGRDDPDAYAFVPAGVQVTGVGAGRLRVGRVQRPDVHVIQAPLAAQEHLVQRPARAHLVFGHQAASFLAACSAGSGGGGRPPPPPPPPRRRRGRAAAGGPPPPPPPRLAAGAEAPSRPRAPSWGAAGRPATRWALHGPL